MLIIIKKYINKMNFVLSYMYSIKQLNYFYYENKDECTV